MKLKLIVCLIMTFPILLQSQDALRINLGNSEKYHLHLNSNGVPMFEVFGNNTFYGWDAGNDTGSSGEGDFNSFFGFNAGEKNSEGNHNTYLGSNSGTLSTIGNNNTNVGSGSGHSNVDGNFNSSLGTFANYYNTEGARNASFGFQAGYRNSTGSYNTYLGCQAGHGNTAYSAEGNVFIGYQAGYYEQGDDFLYISNNSTSEPLIKGNFNDRELEVNGDLTIDVPVASTEAFAELKFSHENTSQYTILYNSNDDRFEIKEGSNQRMVFDGGNLGIKRTPTTNDLEVNGTASKSTAGDWLANSDARLKKNIKPLNSSLVLSKLLQLKGITYEWNDPRADQDRPEGEQYGFTAQNIEKVFPELVSTDNEGYLQTSYGTYDAMYIEAIRALCEKIEVLEKRLNDIENSPKLED